MQGAVAMAGGEGRAEGSGTSSSCPSSYRTLKRPWLERVAPVARCSTTVPSYHCARCVKSARTRRPTSVSSYCTASPRSLGSFSCRAFLPPPPPPPSGPHDGSWL